MSNSKDRWIWILLCLVILFCIGCDVYAISFGLNLVTDSTNIAVNWLKDVRYSKVLALWGWCCVVCGCCALGLFGGSAVLFGYYYYRKKRDVSWFIVLSVFGLGLTMIDYTIFVDGLRSCTIKWLGALLGV